MKRPFMPYGKQSIDQQDIDAVYEVLKSDFLTQGQVVGQFEEQISSLLAANMPALSIVQPRRFTAHAWRLGLG